MGDLLTRYDALLLDLDGTVYRGATAIPGAAEAVTRIRQEGAGVRFVTNNASRSPGQVAEHLTELGISVHQEEVCTSAQAAADVLKDHLPTASTVLVVGTDALAEEVRLVGLRPVSLASDEVAAVVQGMSQNVGWRELSEATLAVRAGAFWVACNVDATLPTERGELLGNGALVAAVSTATGRRPEVAGKPNRPLLDRAARDAQARRPLVVGDRLDTDVAGAHAAEMDALLVLSGVTRPVDLLASPHRPTYLAHDLTEVVNGGAELGIAEQQPDWAVSGQDGTLTVSGTGRAIALLRALCAAHPGGELPAIRAGDANARAALTELGLADRLA